MKVLLFAITLLACAANSQTEVCAIAPGAMPMTEFEIPDDPALALYKTGYAAILERKWDDARKNFQLLLQKYPKNKHADEATYWVAYSYAQTDGKKAAHMYQQFLTTYPQSPYFDDAVADLERLGYSNGERPPSQPLPPREYDEAAAMYEQQMKLEQQRERMERQQKRMFRQQERMEQQRAERSARPEKPLDPGLQIKLEAIRALGRDSEDPKAFEALRSIVLDSSANWEMRTAALESLQQFKNQDQMELLQSLAVGGNSKLRHHAIMTLGHIKPGNDAKTSGTLMRIAEDPRESREIRMASLVALSEMESPSLMPILDKIVTGDADRELRQEAIMLLARTGQSDQTRTIALLKSVASNASENLATREMAIHALAQMKDKQAFALLRNIASTDPNKKMRLSALYALGKQRTEPLGETEALMKELALRSFEDRDTRMAALYALADLRGDTPSDLYEDLALREKDDEVRQLAVHLLAKSMTDKAKAFNTLTGIYAKASTKEQSIKEAALFGIADLGNAQAVSFLSNVARTEQDYELRRQAIYFLGSIGGQEAKAALLEILKKK